MAEDNLLVAPPQALVTQIADGIEGVTAEQVAAVLAGLAVAQSGAPLGTLYVDEATGVAAQRVSLNGVHWWRIIHPDGELSYDRDNGAVEGMTLKFSPSGGSE